MINRAIATALLMDNLQTSILEDAVIASPDLSDLHGGQPRPGWRGYVDSWEPEQGISGWVFEVGAVDRSSPVLELRVGDEVIGTTKAAMPREDVRAAAGFDVAPGFQFDKSVYTRMSRLEQSQLDSPVSVRIVGTNVQILAYGVQPFANELVRRWRNYLLLRITGGDVDRSELGGRLLERLALLHQQAEHLNDVPLAPVSRQEAGHVEAVYLSDSGKVWLIGWTKQEVEHESSVMLVERHKFAGGLAIVKYPRPDLPSGCVGFLGVMDSHWSPAPFSHDFFIYFAPYGRLHLRAGVSTRIVQREVFFGKFSEVRAGGISGNIEALSAVLLLHQTWTPGNSAAAGLEVHASVDRMLMVPGFGCFAEGWVVSPTRRFESLELKVGNTILVADLASTYFKSRPDLNNIVGGGSGITDRAGFITIFRGSLPRDVLGASSLRVRFSEDVSSVHTVDAKHLHTLDLVADSVELLRLFPSLRNEPSFPEFYRAIQQQLRNRNSAPASICKARSDRVLVVQWPQNLDQQLLMLDELSCHSVMLSQANIGLAVLVSRVTALAIVKHHCAELQRLVPGLKLSLFICSAAYSEFDNIPFVVSDVDAQRFAFIGSGVIPTRSGWIAMVDWLLQDKDEMVFLEVLNDLATPDKVSGSITAEAWGWNAPVLLEWACYAPRFVRGHYTDNGLLGFSAANVAVLRNAATRTEYTISSALADLIDGKAVKEMLRT